MNFHTNEGQKVALTDCDKVQRHQCNQQTHRKRQTTKCPPPPGENVDLVSDVVVSQEDTPQTHRTVREILIIIRGVMKLTPIHHEFGGCFFY